MARIDYAAIEAKGEELRLLEVDLFNKMGTRYETEAKAKLTAGIKEMNVLLKPLETQKEQLGDDFAGFM